MNNKWISVRQEPEINQWIFIYIGAINPVMGCYKGKGKILDNSLNEFWDFKEDDIKFWQPLPLPPTEEPNSISNESIEYSKGDIVRSSSQAFWAGYANGSLVLNRVMEVHDEWMYKNFPPVTFINSENENKKEDGVDSLTFFKMFCKIRKQICADSETDTYFLEDAIRKTFETWKKYQSVTPNVMVGEDELIEKFKEVLYYNAGNILVRPPAEECAKISLQYHQSKLEELEKWIDEQEKKAETNDYFIYAPDLIDKIKSL